MRVISGIKKGHKLKAPKGLDVRPTEDRIKESLFNILGIINEESVVLDLFAGSGSIGIEFLSRGAKKSYFVDISPISLSIIKDNLNHTDFLASSEIIKSDGKKAINKFHNNGILFDYIYLDPPFKNKDLLLDIIETIGNKKILDPEGIIIVEHERELLLEEDLFDFIKYKTKYYGSVTLDFYRIHKF